MNCSQDVGACDRSMQTMIHDVGLLEGVAKDKLACASFGGDMVRVFGESRLRDW